MSVILISYIPGLFGEFSCYLFSLNDNFVNTKETIVTKDNRYLFPNYLEVINLNIKNLWSDNPLIVSDDDIKKLNSVYLEKNICVPTHWFNVNSDQCNLPGTKIRFYTYDISILKLSYCLFWIKSHKNSRWWPERRNEVISMINDNHKHSSILKEILNEENYQNWKFLSVKENILKDEKLDIDFYIKEKFFKLFNTSFKKSDSWIYFDIGKLIHGDSSNINEIESLLNIKINKLKLEEYREKNLAVIKNHLNLSFEDFKTQKWFDNLKEFIKN